MSPQTVALRPAPLANPINLVKVRHDEEGTLSYELHIFDFDKAPSFVALSYARGTELAATPLKCLTKADFTSHGSSSDIVMIDDVEISMSLYQALNQLSELVSDGKSFLSRDYMWIDALCINQRNSMERGEQILNMHRIYGSATEMLIYLGEAQHDSKETIAAIAAIAAKMTGHDDDSTQDVTQNLAWNLTENQVTALATAAHSERKIFESETNFQKHNFPGLSHPFWPSLAALYTRAWFSRLWTFQEALLASNATVICGDSVIGWSDVRKVGIGLAASQLMYVKWFSLRTIISNHQDPIPHGAAIRNFRNEFSETLFPSFLSFSCEREVSNYHDRVYAVLGLAPEQVRSEVIVRYDAPLSEVYGSFSKAMMKRFYLDSILRSVRSKDPATNLPSWCPDFRCQSPTLYITSGHCRSGFLAKDLSLSTSNPRIITIAGAELDVVAQIIKGFHLQWRGGTSDIFGIGGDAARLADWIDSCQNLIETHKPELAEDEVTRLLTISLLAHNPSHDNSLTDYPVNAVEALRKIRSRLRKLALGASKEDVKQLTDEEGELTNETFTLMCRIWLNDSAFFVTQAGRFGIAYDNICEGDKLVALFSEGRIYALRQVAHGSHHFVSICYVTELSDGQIFSEADLLGARKEFMLG